MNTKAVLNSFVTDSKAKVMFSVCTSVCPREKCVLEHTPGQWVYTSMHLGRRVWTEGMGEGIDRGRVYLHLPRGRMYLHLPPGLATDCILV